MSVTIDAFSNGNAGAGIVLNTTIIANTENDVGTFLTVGASASAMLLAFICLDNFNDPAFGTTTFVWDKATTNQTFTLIGTPVYSSAINNSLGALGVLNPTAGDLALSIINSGNTSGNSSISIVGISFDGTDTTSVGNAFPGYATATGTSSTASNTTSAGVPSGGMAIAEYLTGAGVTTFPTDGGTLIDDEFSQLFWERLSASGSAVSSSFNLVSSMDWASMIIGVAPPSGGGPVIENVGTTGLYRVRRGLSWR